MSKVTQLLQNLDAGDPQARDVLFEAVYDELRQMAAAQMAREHPGQTLQPTALVHEAWMRLNDAMHQHNPSNPIPVPEGESGERRRYFFAAAAEAMRRILIEQARRKQADKRGGQWQRVNLDSGLVTVQAPDQFADLHLALKALGKHDARKAELVRLRYFLGLSLPDIADILAISQATAERDWAFARAWLYSHLQSCDENEPDSEGVC